VAKECIKEYIRVEGDKPWVLMAAVMNFGLQYKNENDL
jgi:hypothetical protein